MRSRIYAAVYVVGVAAFALLLGGGIYRSLGSEGRVPTIGVAYGDYIEGLLARGEDEAALRQMRLLVTLSIDQPEVAHVILPVMIDLARRRQDRETYLFGLRQLVARRRNDPAVHANLASVLLASPDATEAELREAGRNSSRALSLGAGSAVPLLNLGQVALREGRREDAFSYWQRARRIDEKFTDRLIDRLDSERPGLADAFRRHRAKSS